MREKMTRRLLEKKAVKLSFHESSEDQDFNCNWDLNFSSDEDIFLKGKSEILWSRSRDLLDSPDSYQSFSDLTGRTLSSCSWHNDEFDMKSSSKVHASLEAIDSALYEKVKSPLLSETVFQECCDWAEKFPYFRVKGKQIPLSGIDSFSSHSRNSANIKNFDLGHSTSSLHLEGKKLPIHANNIRGISSDNIDHSKVLNNFEEILKDEEEYEEYFAVHKSDQPSDSIQVPINDSSKAHTTLKLLQDKVIDKLVSEMWPSVIAFLENLDYKSNLCNISDDLQLPPINVANEQKIALCLKRPKTEGSSVVCTEFPKLESILTVSPKVLQKRELGCTSRIGRPNSEMTVNSRVPSKSMKSAYSHSNSVQINSESQFLKSSKESESLCLVLPSLEEDFQDSSSVLRGFHIEPGRKDLSNKPVQSSQNDYNISNTSRENEYFLPPIDDKSYIPSNLKLTKNLFTFYGSPVMQDKNKYHGSARYKKTNSRPNTSVSKKNVKSHEVTQQVPVNSGLYITAKGVTKTSSNVYAERNSEVSLVTTETVEESQEKSVTLFPIVTSLTPHEDKNATSVKKGLLHTFLGGKKR